MKTLAQRIMIESQDEYYDDTYRMRPVPKGFKADKILGLACEELSIDLDAISTEEFDECASMLHDQMTSQVADPRMSNNVFIRFGTEFTDEELVENLGPYVIMTEKHTWGRGHTAFEAAKNASVYSDWTYCQLYKSNGFIKGLINVNDIDGGAQYHFSELGERTEKLDESLTNILRGSIKVARGHMKTNRKEKVLVIKWKEEEA